MATSTDAQRRILVIGSGIAGVCLGIRLRQAGFESFTLLEKAERLGGTWRDNTDPEAACDTPSSSYCFSFEQRTDWSRKWSPQGEILGYLEHCVRKYGLGPRLRFGAEVASARFDGDACLWRVRTRAGEELEAEVLASGPTARPRSAASRAIPPWRASTAGGSGSPTSCASRSSAATPS
jgi:cation diffusion facilitator CzcD-associated flavoprotein CzcO